MRAAIAADARVEVGSGPLSKLSIQSLLQIVGFVPQRHRPVGQYRAMHPGIYGKSGIAGNVESVTYGLLNTVKGATPTSATNSGSS